jgi:hypothetical protein
LSHKSHTLITISLVLFFAAMTATLYHYRQELKIPKLHFQPSKKVNQTVSCAVFTAVGSKELRLGFGMPFKGGGQKRELERLLPRIKHDLQVTANQPKVASWFEQRDFDAIKDHLLKIINTHSERPVKVLYLEFFFFD